MSGMPFMPMYWKDYLSDTLHLRCDAHGAYLLLISHYWLHGKGPKLDDRQLADIARMSLRAWRSVRNEVLAFFQIDNGCLRHKRIDFELRKAKHLHDVRSKAGSKGGTTTQSKKQQSSSTRARVTGTRSVLKDTSLDLISESKSHYPARARENGAAEKEVLSGEGNPGGRFAPLAASPPLKAKKKELLRSKLLRYSAARFTGADRAAAFNGLSGADPEHSEQWWLDYLDASMRAEHWDDTR